MNCTFLEASASFDICFCQLALPFLFLLLSHFFRKEIGFGFAFDFSLFIGFGSSLFVDFTTGLFVAAGHWR